MLNIKQRLANICAIYNKEISKETLNIKQNLANKCAIYNKEANKEMLNVKQRLANKCAIYNKEASKEMLNIKIKTELLGWLATELMGLSHKASGLLGRSLLLGKACRIGKDIK